MDNDEPTINPDDLIQFTGTEQYHAFQQLGGKILLTDGAYYFVTRARAHWFVSDLWAFQLIKKVRQEPFQTIILEVKNKKGVLRIEDGNKNEVFKNNYEYTDCPDGVWRFFYTNNVLMVPSEY